jgi:hypothetical protein
VIKDFSKGLIPNTILLADYQVIVTSKENKQQGAV